MAFKKKKLFIVFASLLLLLSFTNALTNPSVLSLGTQTEWTQVIIEGDSLSSGYEGKSWTLTINDFNAFSDANLWNFAVAGQTADTMVGQYATEAGSVPADKRQLFILYAGTNDINTGVAAADIYADLQTLWAAAKADGYKVVAFTIQPIASTSSAKESVRQSLNTLIISEPDFGNPYEYQTQGVRYR